MLNLTGGYSYALTAALLGGKHFVIHTVSTYRCVERSMRLRRYAKAASQCYYPDIRLNMDGTHRYH